MIKIFTEGSSTYGFGHLVRCLTIVKYCKENNINFAFIIDGDDSSKEFIDNHNGTLINWKEDNYLSENVTSTDIVIVDSYYVTIEQLNIIKEKSRKCLIIDDYNRLNYENFVIINPNFCAEIVSYNSDSNEYLLGEKYILLRNEFVNNKFIMKNKEVKSVLITLGGSDILNLTPKLIEYLTLNYPSVILNVVVGFGYENIDQIKAVSTSNVYLHYSIEATKMVELMLDNDFIISAAGQTVNEILKLGCPACFIKVIENQELNVKYFNATENGFLFTETDFSSIDKLFLFENRVDLVEKLKLVNNEKSGAEMLFKYIERSDING